MISHFLDFVRCNLFLHIYYSVFKVQLLQLFSCSGGDKGIRTLDPLRAENMACVDTKTHPDNHPFFVHADIGGD